MNIDTSAVRRTANTSMRVSLPRRIVYLRTQSYPLTNIGGSLSTYSSCTHQNHNKGVRQSYYSTNQSPKLHAPSPQAPTLYPQSKNCNTIMCQIILYPYRISSSTEPQIFTKRQAPAKSFRRYLHATIFPSQVVAMLKQRLAWSKLH